MSENFGRILTLTTRLNDLECLKKSVSPEFVDYFLNLQITRLCIISSMRQNRVSCPLVFKIYSPVYLFELGKMVPQLFLHCFLAC